MIATATAPIRSTSGAPVTERAALIAGAVTEALALRARMVAEIVSGTPSYGVDFPALHALDARIVQLSARYDYYNWRA